MSVATAEGRRRWLIHGFDEAVDLLVEVRSFRDCHVGVSIDRIHPGDRVGQVALEEVVVGRGVCLAALEPSLEFVVKSGPSVLFAVTSDRPVCLRVLGSLAAIAALVDLESDHDHVAAGVRSVHGEAPCLLRSSNLTSTAKW